jgi:hypothetical protein
MRRLSVQISVAALAIVLASAVIGETQANLITTGAFTLKVVPGSQYNVHKRFLLFFRISLCPQLACWIENSDGEYVGTIYVTADGAKNNFAFAPRGGRPEALPVWSHRKIGKAAVTDAVSTATSRTPTERSTILSMPPGRYRAFIEVNRSFDYNETYTRANSRVNGQPSIVYQAEINVGMGASVAKFVPIGVGSVDGSDGNIRPGLAGITTALSIIKDAEIDYGE